MTFKVGVQICHELGQVDFPRHGSRFLTITLNQSMSSRWNAGQQKLKILVEAHCVGDVASLSVEGSSRLLWIGGRVGRT